MLVTQDKPVVEVYDNLEESVWRMSTYDDLDKAIQLESISIELQMREIYLGVDINTDAVDTF